MAKPARGWFSVYIVAFVLMVAAGTCLALAARGFLEDRWLLWASIGLSAAAIVTAVVGVRSSRDR